MADQHSDFECCEPIDQPDGTMSRAKYNPSGIR